MPTAMKNSPSSRPLNGSISASSACRYSDSASSTPARKAPSAIDRPTACISSAVTTTVSSVIAVKASRMPLAATSRSSRLSSSRPPITTAASTATTLAMPSAMSVPLAPSMPPPSRGTSASIGIAARSWNSSTEKAARPCRAVSWPFSARVCKREGGRGQRQAEPGDDRGQRRRAERVTGERDQRRAHQHLRAAEPEH